QASDFWLGEIVCFAEWHRGTRDICVKERLIRACTMKTFSSSMRRCRARRPADVARSGARSSRAVSAPGVSALTPSCRNQAVAPLLSFRAFGHMTTTDLPGTLRPIARPSGDLYARSQEANAARLDSVHRS